MGKLAIKDLIKLGRHFLASEKYEEALGYFNKAILRYQDNPIAWMNKGIAYNGLGKINNARYCFDVALKLDPASSEINKLRNNIEGKLAEADDEIIGIEEEPTISQPLLKYSQLRAEINDLGEGVIYSVVGIISLIGFIVLLIVFAADIKNGFGVNWAMLISIISSVLTAFAWFALTSNHIKYANIVSRLMKSLEQEKNEK